MGPEVPSRARRALPALRRSEKEDGRRPSECSRIFKYKENSVSGLIPPREGGIVETYSLSPIYRFRQEKNCFRDKYWS